MKYSLSIKKLLIGFTALITAITTGVSTYVICSEIHRNNIKREVTSNLEEIMKQQEDRLGISYDHKPKMKFKVPNDSSWVFAYYTSENDTIHFNSETLSYDKDSLVDSYINWLELYVKDYRLVLEHELGHFYYDQFLEKQVITKEEILNKKNDINLTRLVSEGIAEYFERTYSREEDNFTNDEWPNDINNLEEEETIRVIYSGGYHLVKPIIDKYGLNGIHHLIINPPKMENLQNLPSYQQQVLQYLMLKEKKLDP